MNLITDLLPLPGSLGDAEAEKTVAQAAGALETGNDGGLSDAAAAPVARMRQAADKIASGIPIRRTGELITLAQFGAASAGRLVAEACDDAPAVTRCEGCFVGYFLTEVVRHAPVFPGLVPTDLTADGGDPAAAYAELSRRAGDAMRTPGTVAHRGLRRYLARRSVTAQRRIVRLRRHGPASPRAELTAVDRLLVSIRLFLHREGAP